MFIVITTDKLFVFAVSTELIIVIINIRLVIEMFIMFRLMFIVIFSKTSS